MIGKIVFFNGEQHYIVGQAIGINYDGSSDEIPMLMLAISKVEAANTSDVPRATWVCDGDVSWIASQIIYYESDWYRGVNDGKEKK